MLFPLSKSFSSTGIFQKGGEHNARPLRRTWSIDHTGSAERTKELHKLLCDKKPYKSHEMLAKRRAMEGKKQDQERLRTFREHLGDMRAKIEAEADERREQMKREIREYKNRQKASDTNIREMLKEQSEEHRIFLLSMEERVSKMPPIMGEPPPREAAERTEARKQARADVGEHAKGYKEELARLREDLDNRGSMEWTYVPRPSQDAVIRKRKAEGMKMITQQKAEYEEFLEQMDRREQERMLKEQRQRRKEMREAEGRLSDTKTQLLQSLNSTTAQKKSELNDIVARVNNRPSGQPKHSDGQPNEAFVGYCSAGYTPVVRSSKRERDIAAERCDRDGNVEETNAKLLVLAVPMGLRDNILRAHPARLFTANATGTAKEWNEMSWKQRWDLISRYCPEGAIIKARQTAGIDVQDMSMSAPMNTEQRTLSPRTLGVASAS